MKFFVINLDRSPSRMAYMQRQAAELGLDLERIVATDGAMVPTWLAPQFQSSALLPGEIGCYASHLVAAREVVDRSLPFAVISEDDVPLARDFAEVVGAAIAAAPAGWDIIHLTEYNLRTLVEVASLNIGYHLVRYTRLPKNTAAYILSNTGARKWLRPTFRTCPSDVDLRYAWRFNLNVVGVYPPVAFRSAGFASEIDTSGIARVRSRRRKWSTSIPSRLYGAIWQARQLGLRKMLVGQVINAVKAVRRGREGTYRVPMILGGKQHVAVTHSPHSRHGIFSLSA